MPELPEVETALQGIKPHILHQKITRVEVRHYGLRFRVPSNLAKILKSQTIQAVKRRGKYILLQTATGHIIIHLGVSGRMRILKEPAAAQKHDHIDLFFQNNICLRFTDPRRFGCYLWTTDDITKHPLLKKLGPEPLTKSFSGQYLFEKSRGRKVTIKTFIMNSHIVVGVGNIYAAEALFLAGIHPLRASQDVTLKEYELLAAAIKRTLKAAIKKGGTTLKDFLASDGQQGYFALKLKIYGRADMACYNCGSQLIESRLGGRSTVFCSTCQK